MSEKDHKLPLERPELDKPYYAVVETRRGQALLEVAYDDNPTNPRSDRDNIGALYSWTPRITCLDENPYRHEEDFLAEAFADNGCCADHLYEATKATEGRLVPRLVTFQDYDYEPTRDRDMADYVALFDGDEMAYDKNGGEILWDVPSGDDLLVGCEQAAWQIGSYLASCYPYDLTVGLLKSDCAIVPIFGLSHSGVTISARRFNDRWDSGVVGFGYIDGETARDNFPNADSPIEAARNYLISGIEEYDRYLNVDVYEYTLYDLDGDEIGAERNINVPYKSLAKTITEALDITTAKSLGCHHDVEEALDAWRGDKAPER